ncbi:MAG: hypothetical protein CVV64_07050 [Candidatus Wallbacteria bacterium HGW-Wallbacteria-1]|jgi:prepilin-type N-terminal cleavage/methylation domain-containing protein|uniref:Prepilin-type N-terminal cleavage/methylation domain-containing protein n=1 Tax=Candidatus Wallbacteria bacterium HGW-Wallbacteria-1 TaxID=2013854 RepID=A0A2N1PT53_9BACT|nr:MAG: hypothetical protein CVV64_07050 [Candidatus Wallbacteria bacterium HGW-Wallbacteria-1]
MNRNPLPDSSFRLCAPRGFTLVELLIAIAIFTFLIIPIVNIFESITKMGARTRNEIIAAGLATRRMEEFKCTPYETLRTYMDNLGGGYDSAMNPIPGFPGFRERVEVTYYPNPVPQTVQDKYRISIKVTIEWEDKRSIRVKNHTLLTILTRKASYI